MPRAHLCSGCGRSLAKVAAPADPIYGLPIVRCPGCGICVVRRHRPDTIRAWRSILLLHEAARSIAVTGFMLLVFAGGYAGLCSTLQWSLSQHGLGARSLVAGFTTGGTAEAGGLGGGGGGGGGAEAIAAWWKTDEAVFSLVCWAAMAIGAGAWLAAALPHARRALVFALWAATVLLFTFGPYAEARIEVTLTQYVQSGRIPNYRRGEAEAVGSATLAALGLPIAALGCPLGLRVRRSRAFVLSRRLSRHRTRLRRARRDA